MLVEGLTLWLARTNAWIVAPRGPGGECVIVDAPPEPGAILERLDRSGLRLAALIATHGHADHVGGVATVARARPLAAGAPLPVHIHDGDRHLLADPVGTGAALGAALAAEHLDLRMPELVHRMEDGSSVTGAGMTFTALHTPGHTPGSTCLLLTVDGEEPILFSGDHLFAGSVGRTDLPGGSFEELMASMTAKILPLADHVRVLPGHGPTTTIGTERRTNPFLARLGPARR